MFSKPEVYYMSCQSPFTWALFWRGTPVCSYYSRSMCSLVPDYGNVIVLYSKRNQWTVWHGKEIIVTELRVTCGENNGALLIWTFPACLQIVSESMLHEIVSGGWGVNVRFSVSFFAPICKCTERTLK